MNNSPPDSTTVRREAILHRSYLRMSGQGRALMLRVRPTGLLACGLSFVLLFLGADPTRSVTYQLFALLFCMITAAVLSTAWMRATGTALVRAPHTALPGRGVEISVEVRNTGKRAWRGIRVAIVPPPPVPTLDEFINTPEPGERSRNLFDRTFIFYRFTWLGERRQTFAITCSEPFDLAPGKSHTLSLPLQPLRRGTIDLRDIRLAQDDLFGFFRRLFRLETYPARILVLPRPATLHGITAAGRSLHPDPSGQAPWHRSGQSDEFLSLRIYRPGDPMHHIHWPSFARSGIPIVREFEDIHRPRTALILDTLLPTDAKSHEATRAFEAAIEAAAALTGALSSHDNLLELLLVQERAHNFTGGYGQLHVRRLLEILAAIHPTTTGSLAPLEQLALSHATACPAAWYIGVIWDEKRLGMLQRLRARGMHIRAIIHPPGTGPRPDDLPSWADWREPQPLPRAEDDAPFADAEPSTTDP